MIKKKEETEVKQMSKRISDLRNNLKDRLLGKSFDPPPELEERVILNSTVSRTIKTNSQEKVNRTRKRVTFVKVEDRTRKRVHLGKIK